MFDRTVSLLVAALAAAGTTTVTSATTYWLGRRWRKREYENIMRRLSQLEGGGPPTK